MTALTLATPSSSTTAAQQQQQLYAIQHNQKQRAHQFHQLQLQQQHMQQQQQIYHQQLLQSQQMDNTDSSSPSPSPPSSRSHTAPMIQHFQASSFAEVLGSSQDMDQNHQLAILGDHAASPPSMFMDLPGSGNQNNMMFDCESTMVDYHPPQQQQQMIQQHILAQHHHIQQIHAGTEYVMGSPTLTQSSQHVKSEFSTNDHIASSTGYMLAAMARSLSGSELSEICEASMGGVSTTSAESPALYASQVAMQQQQLQHFRPTHSYSNSSISNMSEVSCSSSSASSLASMSPRSPFTQGHSAATCDLSRTLSQPSMSLSHHHHHSHGHHHSVSSPAYHGLSMDEDYGSMEMIHPLRTSSSSTHSLSSSSSASSLNKIIKRENGELSSTSTSSSSSPKRSRGRRVSSQLDMNSLAAAGGKVFTCEHEECGKIFKRSEHLKRHVRSIHTQEKPFACPKEDCSKRFSRSDNLNQHVRIHRHTNKQAKEDKNKAMSAFTPFLVAYSDADYLGHA
ncbi:hypothetical protein EMPS_04776 [Entomortierella parvispora]|uniref:C2H2-type domain-containing protein n=1 Tax=Entomortierella parvispora TaxID=205924 RepID=A0A9P3H923_9FUNG|nr:hypothetical protein EMPS_04776 [Entomortierella parvispora]